MTEQRHLVESASEELAARAIGAELRQAAAGSVPVEHWAAEADRLRRVVAQSVPRAQTRLSLRLALAATLMSGALALGAYVGANGIRHAVQAPLTAEVRLLPPLGESRGLAEANDAEAARFERVAEQFVTTSDSQLSLLRFSDGTKVTADIGSRLRVAELFPKGATVLVEKGQADVRVIHRDRDTHWSVAAGPFSVSVTGTHFGIGWDPAQEKLVVALYEGHVEIKGPRFASPAALRAGQRFEALAAERGWTVSPLDAGPTATMLFAGLASERAVPIASNHETVPKAAHADSGQASAQDWAKAAAQQSAPRSGTPQVSLTETLQLSAPPTGIIAKTGDNLRKGIKSQGSAKVDSDALTAQTVSPAAEGRQWSKLVASGEFRQVTREADTMGLMICLAQCSAMDLRALADASRYTGRLDTAEAALRELYKRFPAQANTAAYLLGVVDEARGRNSSALRWYEEYLSRVASGGFVAEVRAARLRMLVATGARGSAQKAAREYLDSYPNGAMAGLARKVLEGR